MHIYIQDSDRNYMKMNKNASVWTKLKFNFNFVRFLLSVCTEHCLLFLCGLTYL